MRKLLSLVCLFLIVVSVYQMNFTVTAAEVPASAESSKEDIQIEEYFSIANVRDVLSSFVSRGKLLIQAQKNRIYQLIRIINYTKIAQLILQ